MDGMEQDLTPEEKIECKKILESVKLRANYGSLVFSSLLSLDGGEAAIEDILARYERDNLVERFNILFDSLSQKGAVLNYSDEDWVFFYYEFVQDVDLAAYIDLFDKGLFARSFVAEMYSYSAPAFKGLSQEEKDGYLASQVKYAPVPLEGLLVAKQIIDMLILLDKQYGGTKPLIDYDKHKN